MNFFLGSHAALTCHIVVMRHIITGVVSVGHFDNFCCWQFGDDSSAHRDGINIMLEEIGDFSLIYIYIYIYINVYHSTFTVKYYVLMFYFQLPYLEGMQMEDV